MSKLSRFPNEIFYEIFEYLIGYDILHAFKGLNRRIDLLLQNYSKYKFNFQLISKFQFDFICKLITCEQIQSLILANNDHTCRQIQTFFRLFYIRKFINIESLKLIEITKQDLNKLISKIQFLTKLSYLSIDLQNDLIPKIQFGSSLKYLSVTICSMNRLNELLLSAPLLTKLHVGLINDNNPIENSLLITNIYQLKIKLLPKSNITFNEITLLFQWMPKLRHLTFIAKRGMTFIDGNRWKFLIHTYLSELKQFHFAIHPNLTHIMISQSLLTFQTPFWLEEKQWFIHCNYYPFPYYRLGSLCRTNFYTLPYCDEQFPLYFSTKTLTKSCQNQYSTIKNVYLSIDCSSSRKIEEIYDFPNINSLTIQNLYRISSIDDFINLSNIKYLTFEQANVINSKECFAYLLKHMTNLQSLKLSWHRLIEITDHFNDQQVCSLLSKQIKYLDLINMISDEEAKTRQALEKLNQIFSNNLEKLSISILSIDNIAFLLNQMFELNSLKIECNTPLNIDDVILWLKRNNPVLKNCTNEIRVLTTKRICLLLWIE